MAETTDEERPGWFSRLKSAGMPSFFLSALIHATLIAMLAIFLRPEPRGVSEEPSREVGVVLKRVNEQGKEYYENDSTVQAPPSPTVATNSSPRELVGETSPVDISAALPKQDNRQGLGPVMPPGMAIDAGALTSGKGPNKSITGGLARTIVYGIVGEGQSFVYVFDRSASMEGGPLQSAKTQLIKSLQSLGETHRFNVIFYNQEPTPMRIAGLAGGLTFATQQNKELAARFISAIPADGATQHERPLMMALSLDPDVIFFLTDADQPGLSEAQLQNIKRRNQRAVINTIEFGLGPKVGGENFLSRIATDSGGKYLYIDITAAGIK